MDLKQIVFERNEDTKHRTHQWQYDQIDAVLDGQKIGYIRVAYINGTNIERFQAEPLLLAYDVLSERSLYKTEYVRNSCAQKLTETNIPKLFNQAQYTAFLLHKKGSLEPVLDALKQMDDDQLKDFVQSKSKQIWKVLFQKDRIKTHAQYHFCRPDVDFIRVDDAFLGQGVGTQLYHEAAQWMAEKGMVLHSSTLQEDGAVRAWERMKESGEADVLCIDGERSRYRYVKNIDPSWLEEMIVFRPYIKNLTPYRKNKKTC